MARSETLLDRVSRIQSDQVAAFGAVNHNLNRLTESLAHLDVGEMKREMVGAMRDMIREESVAQLCAQRARSSAHETTSGNPAAEMEGKNLRHPEGRGQALIEQKRELMPGCCPQSNANS